MPMRRKPEQLKSRAVQVVATSQIRKSGLSEVVDMYSSCEEPPVFSVQRKAKEFWKLSKE